MTGVRIPGKVQRECLEEILHSLLGGENIVRMNGLKRHIGINGFNTHTALGCADENSVIPCFVIVMGGLSVVSNCHEVHFFGFHSVRPHIQRQLAITFLTGLGVNMDITMISDPSLVKLLQCRSILCRGSVIYCRQSCCRRGFRRGGITSTQGQGHSRHAERNHSFHIFTSIVMIYLTISKAILFVNQLKQIYKI